MDFRYSYNVKPKSLWAVSMYNMYKSMVGLVNIIFTISIVLLTIRFWSGSNLLMKIIIVVGVLLFPVFQPLFIFLRSRKIVSRMPINLEMIIDGKGLLINSGENQSRVGFNDIKSILRIRGMLILYTNSKHAFILDKETLQGKEQELFDFLLKETGKNNL